MKKLVCIFLLIAFGISAQDLSQCKKRFNSYLNFHATLSPYLKFGSTSLTVTAGFRPPLVIYEDEMLLLSEFFEYAPLDAQLRFLFAKGSSHLSSAHRDSLKKIIDPFRSIIRQPSSLPLKGYRIAIDPGHFGTTLQEAAIEQKYLYFTRPGANNTVDTVKLFESVLTFNTATILRNMLIEQGADVLVTRKAANLTSFGCSFGDWMKHHRTRSLDSLLKASQLSPARHKMLRTCNDYKFFWEFYRDYELANRARVVNAFDPHVTIIVHYNVDEKNAPWKKETSKNYSMAFIPGAFTPGDLDKPENRAHFMRLLLTNQLERSEKLAAETVSNFSKNLSIPIASASNATYLAENCISTGKPGVFCRNLVLCRKINSPLVYGESLYQDNEKECLELMRCDVDAFGVKTSARLVNVASSYYDAVFDFLVND